MRKLIFTSLHLYIFTFFAFGEAFASDFSVTLLTSDEVLGMENGSSKTVVIGQAHKNNGYFFGYNGSSAVSTLFGATMAAGQTTAESVAKQDDYRMVLHKTSEGKYSIESEAHEGVYLTNKVGWEGTEFGWTAQSVSALASTSDMSADYDITKMVRFSSTGTKSYLNSQGNISNWTLKDGEGEWSVWCIYEVSGDIPEDPDPEPTPEDEDICKNVPAYRIPCGTFLASTYLTSIKVSGEGVLGELNYEPTKPSSKINIYTAQRITVARGEKVSVLSTLSSQLPALYTVFADLDGDGQFEQSSKDLEAEFTVPADTHVMGRIRVRIDKNNGTANADIWGIYYDFPVYFADQTAQRTLSLKANSTGRGMVSINGGTADESVSGSFERGETITIKATPAKGYGFLGWQSNRYVISKSAELTLTLTDNKDLTAIFGAANDYTLNVIGLRPGQEGGLVVNGDTLQTGDSFSCSGTPTEGVDYTIVDVESLNSDVTADGKTLTLAYFIGDKSLINSHEKYQLICQRGVMHYKEGDTYLINTKSQDYPQENAEWIIDEAENGYYFYNVGAGKYLSTGNTYSLKDSPTTALTINDTKNEKYPFYMKMGSKYVNIGGSYQLVVDTWSTLDAGNQFRFVYVGGGETGVSHVGNGENGGNGGNGGNVGNGEKGENCYDLTGRKVQLGQSGLYIIGGKKVLVK